MVTVKDQSSHLLYLNTCIQTKNCEHFDSICHLSCKKIIKEKSPLLHKFVCFHQMPNKRLQAWSLSTFQWEFTSFLKNYVTSEGAVSHNVFESKELDYLELVNLAWFFELAQGSSPNGKWWWPTDVAMLQASISLTLWLGLLKGHVALDQASWSMESVSYKIDMVRKTF